MVLFQKVSVKMTIITQEIKNEMYILNHGDGAHEIKMEICPSIPMLQTRNEQKEKAAMKVPIGVFKIRHINVTE